MNRRRSEGGLIKTKDTFKEKMMGEMIGNRHQTEGKFDKVEGQLRSGTGKAMDAVREVAQSEEKFEKTEDRTKSGADNAIDAVREVVEKEKSDGSIG